jgi:hypothetical protein
MAAAAPAADFRIKLLLDNFTFSFIGKNVFENLYAY